MSTTTIRKRLALVAVVSLVSGILSIPSASAHNTIVSTGSSAVNTTPTGQAQNSMFVATKLSTSGAAVLAYDDNEGGLTLARSIGLLTKDSSSGTAQTATMLTSGTLSLYVPIQTASTVVAFVATGGTFGTTTTGASAEWNQTRTTVVPTAVGSLTSGSTSVGVTWTAPSTAGTYTISLYNSGSGLVTLTTPAKTLGAQLVVTVVASSAGGSYNATYSYCRISNASSHFNADSNVDGTAGTTNGNSMWVNFALNDAYGNDLDDGNIVVTATNGALVSYQDGATAAAGTASTVVAYDEGAGDAVRVTQGTTDAPQVTTVTITYNGTTVCTKTVAIYGQVSKLDVTVTDVQDLSASTGKADFLEDGWAPTSPRAGHFYVLATDSAGNQVATSSVGTFAVNAASLAGQTIVTAVSVDSSATVTSSTSAGRISTGTYTCGSTAGEVKTVKLDFTTTATGKVTTSPAFTLRCADNPYSYTASWDKASYVQGEIATLTVKFLDSKGNPANSTSGTGTWTSVTPMLTNVSATGAAAGLGLTGTKTYTYTVGTSTGATAGTYVSVIDFTTLTGAGTAVKATPSYKITTGGDTTTNADVLKSIVALIASINKQIQALQKLILQRR
jgi:hypothetical protein